MENKGLWIIVDTNTNMAVAGTSYDKDCRLLEVSFTRLLSHAMSFETAEQMFAQLQYIREGGFRSAVISNTNDDSIIDLIAEGVLFQ